MKVLVVGLGAIGSLMTYIFSKDERVTKLGVVIKRPEDAPIIRSQGIKLKFLPPPKDIPPKYKGKRTTLDPSTRYTYPDDVFFSLQGALTEVNDWDLIVVALKAYDTYYVVRDIQKFFKPKKSYSILLVQNGWGLEEKILEFLPEEELITSAITIPVRHEEGKYNFTVFDYPKKGVAFAPISKRNKIIRDLISVTRRSGTNIWATFNWRGVKVSKLLLNLIGNATSAITGLPPWELFKDLRVVAIERAAVLELLRAAKANGIKIVDLPGYPVSVIAVGFQLLPPGILKPLLLKFGGKGRGEKLPSMLEDFRRGKRDSEVKWLNGGVVDLAERKGLEAPVNKKLMELVERVYQERRHMPLEDMIAQLRDYIPGIA